MSYSDSTLNKKWRQAVLSWYGEGCIICQKQPVECHHIIKRRNKLLRWDYRNGVPLCKEHHEQSDSIYIRRLIEDKIGEDFCQYLDEMRMIGYKQYILDYCINDKEFKQEKYEEMQEVINADNIRV